MLQDFFQLVPNSFDLQHNLFDKNSSYSKLHSVHVLISKPVLESLVGVELVREEPSGLTPDSSERQRKTQRGLRSCYSP